MTEKERYRKYFSESGTMKLKIADLIDAQAIQFLMDNFYKLARVPMYIVDLEGKILVGVGWQDICTNFHRVHPETCRHCVESDLHLTKGIPPGEFRLYKCKNGMWDIATPIVIGGKRVGNLFSGQFFFNDENLDYDHFRSQARKYGFDEREYIEALESVPRLSRDVVDTAMDFFIKLAEMISELSYSNIRMIRLLAERDSLMSSLQESEMRLRTIMDNSPDPIFMKDRSGHLIIANPATLAAIGKPADKVIGRTSTEFYDDTEIGRAMMENDCHIMESGQTKVFEESINFPDGPRIYLATKTPLFNPDGKVIGLIGVSRDITERKHMEEALQKSKDELEIKVQERTRDLSEVNKALLGIAEELRKSEETYRLLVEHNPVGVFRTLDDPVTRESRRLHCNEAHLHILGYASLQDWLAESPISVFHSEADFKDYREKLYKDGKIINYKVRLKRKDGKAIWALMNATARDHGENKVIEHVMTDITAQKRIEEHLLSAQNKLRAMASEIVLADERSRQHLATELHDTVLQTLGAAKMRSELLLQYIPEDGIGYHTELQNMLLKSITQARMIMTEMSPPVLYELGFIPALEWLSEHMQRQHDIAVRFETKKEYMRLAREIQVLLFQATRELLMNVVKHARAKNVLVKASSVGGKVRIEVIDDGKGFDKRQAFCSDIQSGGFGLFSIRERLRHFGGHLSIRSKPGKGTYAIMTAPLTESNEINYDRINI